MKNLGRDLRVGARMLVKSPGFAAVVLVTVALGVGANTAIFSVVNAVLLRPLPYAEPERLVRVYQTLPREGVVNNGVSFLNYTDFAAQVRSFEGLGAVRMHDFTLTGQGDPVLVVAGTLTSNVFGLLGSRPLLGRGLVPSDDAADAPPVAVLSEKLWRERFGADPGILGKSVQLDQRPFTVVGVMPAIFLTPPNVPPAELWTPLAKDPVFADLQQKRGGHYLTIVGRLKDRVSIPQAEADLATVAQGLATQFPKENQGWGVRVVPLSESLVSGVRTALFLLLGAVAFVFLIACANVANLLLARASGRSREFAIRTALGAGRSALVAQSLAESLLLGLAGGALGIALAFAATGALRAWLPADLPRIGPIGIDARVLAFSFAASLLAAAVFGLAPALQSSSGGVAGALKEGSAGTGESRGKKQLRGVIVGLETAFAFVLLVGAGLLARSFVRLQNVPLGFDPSHVLTAGMSLPRTQYSKPEQWIGFYETLVQRLKDKPGVEGVAASLPLPLYGAGLNFAFKIEGRAETPGADLSANYTSATPAYFGLLKIRLLQGRLFTEQDGRESAKVCVISQTFAKRHFPGEDPIGRRLVFGFKEAVSREIVGVVADVKRDGLGVVSRPEMYVPFVQEPFWAAYVVIRSTGDPMRLAATLRNEVSALDPAMPIEGVQPMTRIVSESVAQPRFRTTLLGLFSGLALALSVIGIYGVISYSVGRRKREVGIRMALGAGRGDVIRLILGEGLALTGAGLAVGAVGAALLTRFLASLLFDVGRLDAPTWFGAALTLAAAGLVASWLPARRAMRVDPVRALREE